ncbi:MAG: AmmeMemoRadiSam system radical SAM enzyme [Armatimonadetes bacterium]|nr:AmmeMemoRadiSam system radical SAM enzyme [Armatimonadota bacterium]PIU60770.1 MAG: AmmeMemoRadiSam system radical SAM enzyme [Armatimonadetes bacterium CG07_land_8_20_14_0_80_59_28]PIY38060.1 MAG: AmmeMemoRadiSam system radical SAM enzyme [Armatimonadetes bacterium CG_4_10_14_3_um_filter_59_10]
MTHSSRQSTLGDLLNRMTVAGELYFAEGEQKVRCVACGHRCPIPEGRAGVCKVRYNSGGKLFVPHGYASGIHPDPIEKKPFFHVLPGSLAMSFGMLGCDFHCGYCQNWVTSQSLRDPLAGASPTEVTPEQLVDAAVRYQCQTVVSTYNEPLITSEWAVSIFKLAKAAGIATGYVSNGNGTPEALEYLQPWTDLYKVDLKSFQDKSYRQLGGVLQNVLDTIQRLWAMGFWVEIVTLVVPGFNDSDDELRDIARFIASVSSDIPWHVTAFHQNYKMADNANTSVRHLARAAEMGLEEGLHFVYAGNIPGSVGDLEDTRCPQCSTTLIERQGFQVRKNRLVGGKCPECATTIPGYWGMSSAATNGAPPFRS